MGIRINSEGSFKHTESLLRQATSKKWYRKLDSFAKEVTEALKEATPKDTGKTSESWDYEIETTRNSTTITWTNSNHVEGYYYNSDRLTPIVLLIVNGHATANGYWIPPNDFVTPTIEPYVSKFKKDVWLEVTDR